MKIFDQIKGMMDESLVKSMDAVFQFDLKGWFHVHQSVRYLRSGSIKDGATLAIL